MKVMNLSILGIIFIDFWRKLSTQQGQILQYNSISCFGSHLSSKRLASADERNSLKQKLKTNEAAKLP